MSNYTFFFFQIHWESHYTDGSQMGSATAMLKALGYL